MSTMYRLPLILLLLGAATPTPAAVVEVRLENFRFVPNDVTIQPGDTVRWTNKMGFHDVRADDGSFSRPLENAPWTFERTFTQAGEVLVHCSIHSGMNGRINVANITVVPGADIAVNTVSDELNADGDCSLREAITSANSNSATDACAIGDGADSIGFGVAGTIVLNSALPAISSDVGIVGPTGDKVIISGGGTAPLLVVARGGILRLDALTLSGGFASDGGAIINQLGGTLTVSNSTFSGNRAQQSGGAIRNLGVATIVNSTFASNAATESGGALAGSGVGANMTLINCTIAANSAALGGGIATEQQGAVTLRNTLIAANAGGNCLALDSGTITDGGGNLDDGTSCGLVDSSSSSNAGAGLDPGGLRDNGGPTQTIALVAGGRAIDRGMEAVCADATNVNGRDERGEPRPRDGDADGGARCDIGAFELQPPLPPPAATAADQDPRVRCAGFNCRVLIQCDAVQGSTEPCNTRVDVFIRAGALRLGEDGAAKARPRIRFAGAVANIPPGGTTNLRLTLTRRGRQIVRTSRRNKLRGVMEIRNSIGPVQTVRVTIRLRR